MTYPRCPLCGSNHVAQFIYGCSQEDDRLEFDETGELITDLSEEKEEDIIYVCGDTLPLYRPEYHCKNCGTEYGRYVEDPEELPYNIIGLYFIYGDIPLNQVELNFKLT